MTVSVLTDSQGRYTVENLPAADTLGLTINKTDSYSKLSTALGTVNLTKRP